MKKLKLMNKAILISLLSLVLTNSLFGLTEDEKANDFMKKNRPIYFRTSESFKQGQPYYLATDSSNAPCTIDGKNIRIGLNNPNPNKDCQKKCLPKSLELSGFLKFLGYATDGIRPEVNVSLGKAKEIVSLNVGTNECILEDGGVYYKIIIQNSEVTSSGVLYSYLSSGTTVYRITIISVGRTKKPQANQNQNQDDFKKENLKLRLRGLICFRTSKTSTSYQAESIAVDASGNELKINGIPVILQYKNDKIATYPAQYQYSEGSEKYAVAGLAAEDRNPGKFNIKIGSEIQSFDIGKTGTVKMNVSGSIYEIKIKYRSKPGTWMLHNFSRDQNKAEGNAHLIAVESVTLLSTSSEPEEAKKQKPEEKFAQETLKQKLARLKAEKQGL